MKYVPNTIITNAPIYYLVLLDPDTSKHHTNSYKEQNNMTEKFNPKDFTNTTRKELDEFDHRFKDTKAVLEDSLAKFNERVDKEITTEQEAQMALIEMSEFMSKSNVQELKRQMYDINENITFKANSLKEMVIQTNIMADDVHQKYMSVMDDLNAVDTQMQAFTTTIGDLMHFLDMYRTA